ncbi:hypothetical protein BDV34DRAFT_204719 [Aspergillus parasiticus]|uniref:Uncharacterized protein n=1 Tax=Aspergillus parasiticus TaxID=5067 RepID=A0A5N6D5L5_ASPPA|nr:hypothetical protein BDV34DRAFT_204719 [Aspergillus parasiticus]
MTRHDSPYSPTCSCATMIILYHSSFASLSAYDITNTACTRGKFSFTYGERRSYPNSTDPHGHQLPGSHRH